MSLKLEVKRLAGTDLGKTVEATMVFPFSGPITYTGILKRIEQRIDGTSIVIADEAGPHLVMLDRDDTVNITGAHHARTV